MEGERVKGEVNRKMEPKQKCNDDWRLSSNGPWGVLCMTLFLVTIGVHYKALCNDRTDLSLPELMTAMEAQCRSLGPAFEQPVPEALLLHPVETQFGIAVWVENETWALPVHDTLDHIEKVVKSEHVEDGTDATHRGKFIQRIVRVASFPHNNPHTVGNNGGDNNNNNNNNNRNSLSSRSNGDDRNALAATAATQQLGLGVAKHAYALDLREELHMHGVSFFLAPTQSAESAHVRCFSFEDRQAYCTVPANATAAWLQREVSAAVATLTARWMNLRSFRDVNAVRQWALGRQVRGCQYAMRALQQLQLSVNAHPEMPAPYGVRATVRRLQRLIDEKRFAQFARAADDLQFHPLLLPQLYIPWDQALVNHLSILLPVVGMGILGVRLTISAHRAKRRRAKLQLETTVDDKKEQ
ncbi:putative GPI transamidase component Tta1 [Trypanosoma theileri]|uniref:Putative GPI transamidase component Tta1 n=1 Tax=Trypanosoma theileri TaxID=67003 RepID=A0A1X0NT15_9TRYP|nr:putative GPI transamidase component Tta1 [Trypanosoma theileri]ORC87329.1 putative GPI transamidase component Tta1 [Trypanosoma theileri]